MESASTDRSHGIDIEAQWRPSLAPEDMGGRETDERGAPHPQTKIDATGVPWASMNQEVDPEAPIAISRAAGGHGNIHIARIHPSELSDATTHALAQAKQRGGEVKHVNAEHEVDRDSVSDKQPVDSSPRGDIPDQEQQDVRIIGDFDSGATALWTLYRDEAKSHDEARIQSLKEDMDGVLIFAGLFSASLTSFIIDSKQNLNVDPTDQMVFYLQQNVAMLNQISQQISSMSPQFAIPLSPPPPFPAFNPPSSVVRVNVFWFMALIFSLSAVLLAILVQQWVRDYMNVFQRYGDPLKSARLRQYLNEGCERWSMPVVAEAVPGLLHVSLFLFLVGLGDFVLHINATVGLWTATPIGFSGLLYTFTTLAPIIYPQSPYQNSFSGLFWYLIQKFHLRTYKDRGPEGVSKSVSTTRSQGQMQLAMEESGERKKRDERAIRMLIDNLTEEAEMELFVMAIPGSFNAEWGLEVWKGISEVNEDENKITNRSNISMVPFSETSGSSTDVAAVLPALCGFNDPPPFVMSYSRGENVVHELSRRVAQLLETCKNRGLFAHDKQWRGRTRACVETTAVLVSCANAELSWFGDVGALLGDVGRFEKLGESLSTGTDRSFVIRWICLSIMAIRPVLSGNEPLRTIASDVVNSIQNFQKQEGTPDEQALKNAKKIDENFIGAYSCLFGLALFRVPDLTANEVEGTIITELERINTEAGPLTLVDHRCNFLLHHLDQITHGITGQLPGIQSRFPPLGSIPFGQVLELFMDPLKFPIIPPGQALQSLCSLGPRFRDFIKGDCAEENREIVTYFQAIDGVTNRARCPLQRQLWRLQDLRDGGGLGLIVELFFRALKQLLSTSLSQVSQSALYIGTFRAITSDWPMYKRSLGTQTILLDAVTSEDGIFSDFKYPAYITDEFFLLLQNMLDGQTAALNASARDQLQNYQGSPELRASAMHLLALIPHPQPDV